ncbi:hypothetical protein BKA65DRAFT_74808 [Rhexocercosporidium sp. MPI-PUGE-AT-0058]|nr:hypothetical protein BKA65DRAFT_74808 [Rhexocercosporidium sp. MPI-PUGE-AT-0058]
MHCKVQSRPPFHLRSGNPCRLSTFYSISSALMDEASFTATQVAAAALSCHLWSLSRLLRKAIMVPEPMKETLTDVQRRLERLSLLVLHDIDGTTDDSTQTINAYNRLEHGRVSASHFASVYSICKPLLAMAFALRDYDFSGGTGRKKNQCTIVAKTLDAPGHVDYDPYDESVCAILTKSILECEAQLYGNTVQKLHSSWLGTPASSSSGSTIVDYVLKLHAQQCVPFEVKLFASRQIVTARWEVEMDDMARVITVPDLNHLMFVAPDNKISEIHSTITLYKLHRIVRILIHLARITHWHRNTLPASHTGLRFLHEELRISIDLGRPRVRDVELYENSLRISRRKGSGSILVRTIASQDLLSVFFLPAVGNMLAGLGIFWREQQKGTIGFARFAFDDCDVLNVWAAFLSANLRTTKEMGRYKLLALPPDMFFGDQDLRALMDLKLQHIFQLIPLAINGELDLYSMDSLNSHLISFGRKVFPADTRVEGYPSTE